MDTLSINDSGILVELLQSTLLKLEFFTGKLDGIFGNQTGNAVRRFQKQFGLFPDGIVGEKTWATLSPYLYGYTIYTVKTGDTLYTISSHFNTTVNRILFANPNLNVNNLRIGQSIIVPFYHIVPTNIPYSYTILQMNIYSFSIIYPFLEIGSIGNSVLGNSISYLKIGNGTKEVFYNASFHANEWITSPLLMKFLEDFCIAYVNNTSIYGYDARTLFNNVSLYIVPMVNPDGVNLVTGDISPSSVVYRNAKRISNQYPEIPFPSGWKANIQGVDLNLQFPTGWENAHEIKFEQGFTTPAPRDYVGSSPLSTPEAIAVYNFTLSRNFRLILAYHTQGRVIYWQFLNYLPPASYYIGERFSASSGYTLETTPYNSSFAGFKDWFIQTYNRPGYTIEAGLGENPLPISQFDQIYDENIGILVLGMVL